MKLVKISQNFSHMYVHVSEIFSWKFLNLMLHESFKPLVYASGNHFYIPLLTKKLWPIQNPLSHGVTLCPLSVNLYQHYFCMAFELNKWSPSGHFSWLVTVMIHNLWIITMKNDYRWHLGDIKINLLWWSWTSDWPSTREPCNY